MHCIFNFHHYHHHHNHQYQWHYMGIFLRPFTPKQTHIHSRVSILSTYNINSLNAYFFCIVFSILFCLCFVFYQLFNFYLVLFYFLSILFCFIKKKCFLLLLPSLSLLLHTINIVVGIAYNPVHFSLENM